MARTRIDADSLPRRQLREVERAIGKARQSWDEAVRDGSISAMDLIAYLLAATRGEPLDAYDDKTDAQILELVDQSGPDPQMPSES